MTVALTDNRVIYNGNGTAQAFDVMEGLMFD